MALLDGATTLDLGGSVRAAWSDAARGDLRPAGPAPGDAGPLARFAGDAAAASSTRIDRVAWVSQVHGAGVVVVDDDDDDDDGPSMTGPRPVVAYLGSYDALVTQSPRTALCVLTADCAPLALSSPEGVAGAVHAGWKGLTGGVIEAAVGVMHSLGASEVTAALGPCIHASCYEFSPADLDLVAASYGAGVRGTTADGRPALDLVAGVAAAVAEAGARLVDGVDRCTACTERWFSHRARADTGRQALLVWSTDPTDPTDPAEPTEPTRAGVTADRTGGGAGR